MSDIHIACIIIKQIILSKLCKKSINNIVIPHGVSDKFSYNSRDIKRYNDSKEKEVKIIYASIFDVYKHQIEVLKAGEKLKDNGYNIRLTFAGNYYLPYFKKFKNYCTKINNLDSWLEIKNSVSYQEISKLYADADIGVWASSCEVFGMILLEMMASGLPIASSNKGVMFEILGNSGKYFNPEDPLEIYESIASLLEKPELQTKLSNECKTKAKNYSWQNCSYQTFSFCKNILEKPHLNN